MQMNRIIRKEECYISPDAADSIWLLICYCTRIINSIIHSYVATCLFKLSNTRMVMNPKDIDLPLQKQQIAS